MDDGRTLIDNYHISYLSIGRDVPRFDAVSTDESGAPLVVADPDFDLAAGTGETPSASAFTYVMAARPAPRRESLRQRWHFLTVVV
jgi:hypothetical protein